MDIKVHDLFIEAYNKTPENFGVPSDEVINQVIDAVLYQINLDQ